MKIWVSSLDKVHVIAARTRPERVVSLLGATPFPDIPGYDEGRHHRLEVDDIRQPEDGRATPNAARIEPMIEFLKRWRREEPLLVHCWAGISRSTATAFVAACLHNPEADESDIAAAIAHASPTAYPNTLIVSIADDILGRRGRMADAAAALCADEARKTRAIAAETGEPFFIPAHFDARKIEDRG